MMNIPEWIETNKEQFISLSDRVWEFAELGFTEQHSSALLSTALENEGFEVRRGISDIPTAFVASYGTGKPVIAILGEFDALPELSQEKVPYRKLREDGQPGHGCGHNLLGVGALAAGMAVKEAFQDGKVKGTIRFYGCPAEENGSGKTFMVKAGAFDDVDLCVTWHPDIYNGILGINILANIKVSFAFHGQSAHAAADPHNGRSALDAVELMNVGVNYLREHIIPEGRIHYTITNGGGAPNVVPPEAESLYIIRAPLMSQVQEIYQRVIDIAKGAALMTGTQVEIIFRKGMSNLLLNDTITDVLYEKLIEVAPPMYSDDELVFGRKIAATCPQNDIPGMVAKIFGKEARALVDPGLIFLTRVMPNTTTDYVLPGSTDVGDVSWVTPTGQISATTMTAGTPSHSWQIVAQSGMGIGQKGMLYAGKVMALAAFEFMTQPERLKAARDEFEKKIKATPYVCPIPDGVKPF
jgi:aminobenzoyl-glutamate utilization protein B